MKGSFYIKFSLMSLGLLFSTLSGLWAQRPAFKPQTHQVELVLGSAHYFPQRNTEIDPLVDLDLGSGIIYTYHYSLTHGFRAGVLNRRLALNSRQVGGNTYSGGPDIQDWEFHLGYQYKFHRGIHQVFAGLDLVYSRSTLSDSVLSLGNRFVDERKSQNLALNPYIGYRVFFSPHVSLSLQVDAQYQLLDNIRENDYIAFIQRDHRLAVRGSAGLSFHFLPMKKRCTCPKVRR